MSIRLGIVLPSVLAAVLALAGCGDDPSEGPDAEPTGQSSSSAPSESPPESTPAAEPTPTVAPAAGDPMELSNVAVRAPKGFVVDPPNMSYLRFAFERGGVQSIALANTPAINVLPLRKQAVISIRSHVYSTLPTIVEPVEIGGVEMYHYAGQVNDNEYVEEYGAIYDGSQISLNFLLSPTMPEAERQELVDSVLATLTFS